MAVNARPVPVKDTLTPIRRQYLRIKERYPDAIVLFRLGDFYETFDDDARLASKELNIVLTSKSMGKDLKVPLAGIPAHALDSYLSRLIKQGHRVAVCEQLTDPSASKGLVDRDVVRVVTPGTVLAPSLLEQKTNNYLAAVVVEGIEAGLAHVDITTGEFSTIQMPVSDLSLELDRLSPAELLIPQDREVPPGAGQYVITPLASSAFEHEAARQTLLDHFKVHTLEPFGCDHLPLAVRAAGAVVEYLTQTQRDSLQQLHPLVTYSTNEFMTLDPQTRRNLELFEGGRWGTAGLSLLANLDLTRTPMGGRLLRRWLGQPLMDIGQLNRRQDSVAFFYDNLAVREKTLSLLSRVCDLERVLNRTRLGVAAPREVVNLKSSLESASELRSLLDWGEALSISWMLEKTQPCDDVIALIDASLATESRGEPGDGNVIREGFSPELDELRSASRSARGYIAGLEKRERERTGIKSLKVGYNKVFGYYIELSNANLSNVPGDYVRRQTLVGGERYITPELKEYESLILNASERMEELERILYKQVCGQIGERAWSITALAEALAQMDVFATFAEVGSRYGYVRPRLTEGEAIEIKGGRHPVLERVMRAGTFVPNDTYMSVSDAQVMVITGPNMAGKSTYIRQVALIVLMAQIGSLVPAESATIGLVDRIFTRVGLQDDLATGQSTFMVEMVETASILNHATPRSLVVLDEIGRGTSTYDGLSIAQSVVEYLHNNRRLACKTLFATHYHELTELANTLPMVRNLTVVVSEEDGQVVFLHRIVPGGADKSYGIHVAKLAGLPRAVINRAWDVLRGLEGDGHIEKRSRTDRPGVNPAVQMPLFNDSSWLVEELRGMDVSNMTPLEAINALYRLQERSKGPSGGGYRDLDDEPG